MATTVGGIRVHNFTYNCRRKESRVKPISLMTTNEFRMGLVWESAVQVQPTEYPHINYYWKVPLILDHSYLVWKSTTLKIADASVRILEVLKLLFFQQFLNFSGSQRDMSGPILGALYNNR